MTIPMPEPVILRTVMPDDYRYGHVYGFTRRQMEAYADARVREALQVVAGTVEQYHPKATPKGIAAAIRLIASTDGLTAPPLPGPVEP